MVDFTGMTRLACPTGCRADRCIITERNICAHPCLGGLQEALKHDSGNLVRFAEACKILSVNLQERQK